jgi:hypothetical protein
MLEGINRLQSLLRRELKHEGQQREEPGVFFFVVRVHLTESWVLKSLLLENLIKSLFNKL